MRTRGTTQALAGMAAALVLAGCAQTSVLTSTEATGAPSTLQGTVRSVFDGDTMTVMDGQRKVKVRLLGIDAPEVAHGEQQMQCGGAEARSRLRELAPKGARVYLTTDPASDGTDRFGRTLAYVTVQGRDLAKTLAAEGLVEAWHPASEPEPTRFSEYQAAQHRAQKLHQGSWGHCRTMGR